jgi:hypothetical protein
MASGDLAGGRVAERANHDLAGVRRYLDNGVGRGRIQDLHRLGQQTMKAIRHALYLTIAVVEDCCCRRAT